MNLLTNQYSFITISLGFLIAAGIMLLSNKPQLKDLIAFGVITSALITAWVILHPRQTPLMDEARRVKEMIGAGTPVLLEFQSPY